MPFEWEPEARHALLLAETAAERSDSLTIEPEHLAMALDTEGAASAELARRLGLVLPAMPVRHGAALAPKPVVAAKFSEASRLVVERARRESRRMHARKVGTDHLLLALLDGPEVPQALADAGFTYRTVSKEARRRVELPEETIAADTVMPGFLKGRHVLGVGDLSGDDIRGIFELARQAKIGTLPRCAVGRTAALLFEKPSLRTKVSFHVAMVRLGGGALYLGKDEVGLGKREAVKDVARTLSRMVDALVVRTFDHAVLEELAHWSGVPVINALDDLEHPCQALADFYTVLEHRGDTRGQKMVFVGDGNNVAVSLMLMAPLLGTHFTLACPPGYEPPAQTVREAIALAEKHGTVFEIVNNPREASKDADVLYTDVWISMGQEEDTARRRAAFQGFCIDNNMMEVAKDDVLVLHCLPAHRGDEISDDVLEGPHSEVFDQAENRLHLQQALLSAVL